jgi:hypothetical protein
MTVFPSSFTTSLTKRLPAAVLTASRRRSRGACGRSSRGRALLLALLAGLPVGGRRDADRRDQLVQLGRHSRGDVGGRLHEQHRLRADQQADILGAHGVLHRFAQTGLDLLDGIGLRADGGLGQTTQFLLGGLLLGLDRLGLGAQRGFVGVRRGARGLECLDQRFQLTAQRGAAGFRLVELRLVGRLDLLARGGPGARTRDRTLPFTCALALVATVAAGATRAAARRSLEIVFIRTASLR